MEAKCPRDIITTLCTRRNEAIMLLSRNRSHVVRSRRFVPTMGAGVSGHELERRALTAPAFWRHSPLDPETSQPHITFAVDNAVASTPSNYVSETGSQTVQNIHNTSTVTVQINDQADSMPPSPPVGSYNVSSDTHATTHFDVTGPQVGVVSWTAAGASTGEAYIFAYDSAGPGSEVYLVEHFSADVTLPTSSASIQTGRLTAALSTPREPDLNQFDEFCPGCPPCCLKELSPTSASLHRRLRPSWPELMHPAVQSLIPGATPSSTSP